MIKKTVPREKKTELGEKMYLGKKGPEEILFYLLNPGGQFHPIHKIPEQDFLDGALVGAGSLKPCKCWSRVKSCNRFTGNKNQLHNHSYSAI